ncbi:BCCT family transporter [Xylanibacillus composti]|uniref:Glycine betaine transporter OpuD n=1 Tax=Xylanibacillus composti TaxID=1572762 RepID=A0A8J4H2L4_9BACL|nr:BCCT family transporter [Xylanibacillus composti]MDT9723929.1 BCCT family transporter [Xylanibacillus composti]GIQ67809.1 glycine betaine transporter OpuD [Xylanibacillus composti]
MPSEQKDRLGAVFYLSVCIVGIFVLWGFLFPEELNDAANAALAFITMTFGWFYLMVTFVFLVFAFILAFGPFGRIRLGQDDDEPEYPFFTWLAMLFSAGMGIGLVFWGVAEPIYHYLSPPEGLEGETIEAARTSLRYVYFHWGLQPWAIYTVISLSLAYAQFRKGRSGLISSTFYPLLGERVHGPLGKGIDSLAAIATAFGVATSLGLGAMQINGGLSYLVDFPQNRLVELLIILTVTILFLISASTGLDRGIRYLSNLNLAVAFLLLAFVILAGPTFFILDAFTTTIGSYLGELIQMSFRMTPFSQGTFVGAWTIFYWAWWISWAPFVGSFIARVSKGRTIREFVMGVLFVPTALSMLWFSTFGGTALFFEIFEGRNIAEAVDADITSALFITLEQLPLGTILVTIATLLILTFFVTSADSATFVLGMLTSRGVLHPKTSVKLIWGLLVSAIAAALLLSGGLNGLQTASITIALPFAVILLLMVFSTHKALQGEIRELRRKEKRRIRKLEQLIEEEIAKNGDAADGP